MGTNGPFPRSHLITVFRVMEAGSVRWCSRVHRLQSDKGFSWWFSGEEHTCQCRRPGFDPWVGKIPWRREQQPTPVFLPGISRRQRSLAYSPWGRKRVGHNLVTKTTTYLINDLHLEFIKNTYKSVMKR